MSPDPRIATLERAVEALRDRVTLLEEALGLHEAFPPAWRLTPSEAKVLGVLKRAPVATQERILLALYADRADPPFDQTVKVFICRLRKKLRPHGVTIESRGRTAAWWLTQQAREAMARPWN